MVAERATRLTGDPAFDANPAEAALHTGMMVLNTSNLELHQGGDEFEASMVQAIGDESRRLMATQILTGTGTAPQIQGLRTATGALESTYASTDKGGATMFRTAEDLMDDAEVETDRRRYVLSRDLYRSARSTIREVGSGRYVLDDGFVLGEVPAVKTNILPAGTGVFVEFSFISLVTVANAIRLIVDRLTKPGETLLTALVFFDLGIRDAKAIVLIDAA